MGGACTSAQARNIALCCQLQEVHRALSAQAQRLLPAAAAALRCWPISSAPGAQGERLSGALVCPQPLFPPMCS